VASLGTLAPEWLRTYDRSYLSRDLVAGATLAAVAIPEVLGYTTISQTPLATGLYTIIFPTILFVLLGSSRMLVVGADSATAALMAAGLLGLTTANLTPYSQKWVAYASLVAIVTGLLLLLARVLKLGFLGDFLSASVLIGFLTGVGIQVLSGQIPDMLGVAKGTGNWFEQQWTWIQELDAISWTTFAYGAATIVIIVGFKRFLPVVPGALVAVVLLTALSAATDAGKNGVAVVGKVPAGFPPIGLPSGIEASDIPEVLGISLSCLILIIAQSAATSRSFAMKHGDKVDINRDIVGLSGSNLAAGLSGTFVVNGSPTKTEILDEQKGRSQLANLTMALIALLFTVFFTGLLADMPKSVLAGIVFLIGVGLIDRVGLATIYRKRKSEFWIAMLTCVVVFAVGVEQGIIVAIVISLLDIIRRQYRPAFFVVGESATGEPTYTKAGPGVQSEPGLVVLRYDAELFYANADRFVEDVQEVVAHAPDPVRWVVLDAASINDLDYSAWNSLKGLGNYLHARKIRLGLAQIDPTLSATLKTFGYDRHFHDDMIFPTLREAVEAFHADAPVTASPGEEPPGSPRDPHD
jgi:high affinity sulfate transporter 1